jgi:PPOX class probable F420-dependent enzyme
VTVDPEIIRLAQDRNFAVFTVLLSSGQPMSHVMWVDADEEHVLINTEVHRAKFRAVERDPRVTVAIWELENPYRYAEVRGRVTEIVRGQVAREHIDALSRKYRGRDYDPASITSERVLLLVSPERQYARRPGSADTSPPPASR